MTSGSNPMPEFICVTCGTQYPDSPLPQEQCVICTEERQYVGWTGQCWTTLAQLQADSEYQAFRQILIELGGEAEPFPNHPAFKEIADAS